MGNSRMARLSYHKLWVFCILRGNGKTPMHYMHEKQRFSVLVRISHEDREFINMLFSRYDIVKYKDFVFERTPCSIIEHTTNSILNTDKQTNSDLVYITPIGDVLDGHNDYPIVNLCKTKINTGKIINVSRNSTRADIEAQIKDIQANPPVQGYNVWTNNYATKLPETDEQIQNNVMSKIEGSRAKRENTSLKKILEDKQNEILSLNEALSIRDLSRDVDFYKIQFNQEPSSKETVSISLLSDIHGDETVERESVLGLNEYNPSICETRLNNYFANLVKLISHHQKNYHINKHILAILGDVIGGWIHPELQQTNSKTPIEAVRWLQKIILGGLKYLNDNLQVDEIEVYCVIGNHGRITPKKQFSNGVTTSYEYLLYHNIKDVIELMGLTKIKIIIPLSPSVVVNIFDNNYLFTHGDQFSYAGGVGGIYPPMLRWFSNAVKIWGVKRAFIGHWHTTINIKEVSCNGSIKGYDSYCMGKLLPYEEPQQSLILLNKKRGFTNFQSIFLD